jgi:hypothetical protein
MTKKWIMVWRIERIEANNSENNSSTPNNIFIVEDDMHAEQQGIFETYIDALNEVKTFAKIPWGEEPNNPPCSAGKKCHRLYQIIEYNISTSPWTEVNRQEVLDISAEKKEWLIDIND